MLRFFLSTGLLALACSVESSHGQIPGPLPALSTAAPAEATALPSTLSTPSTPSTRRTATAAIVDDRPESFLTLFPADVQSGMLMRGMHLKPRPDPAAQASQEKDAVWVAAAAMRKRPFDLAKELREFPQFLYEDCIAAEIADKAGAVVERMLHREVKFIARPIRTIVNTHAIGHGGTADSYALVAFADPLDEEFYASLRPNTKSVSQVEGVDVYCYDTERARAMRLWLRQSKDERIHDFDDFHQQRSREETFLAAVAPNVVAVFESKKQAESILGDLVKGVSFAAARPKWLTWDADSTFLGFQAYRQLNPEGWVGTPAGVDPHARGMLVHWSKNSPADVKFTYFTDLADPAPKFRKAFQQHSIYGLARFDLHPEGFVGTISIGQITTGDHRLDAGGAGLSVYQLCGMIILP